MTKLSQRDIDMTVKSASFHVFPGTNHTVCCLTLKNGFTIVGESSCIDPLEFRKDIGKSWAYDDAKRKVWQLEGYLLKDRLSKENQAMVVSGLAAGSLGIVMGGSWEGKTPDARYQGAEMGTDRL